MKTISHTGLRMFRGCQRSYEIAYVQLRRPRNKPAALAFGTLWDLALESWHYGTTAEDRLLRAARILTQESDSYFRAKAEAMLIGYTAKWASEPVEVVATQVGFEVPIVHPDTGETHSEYAYKGVLDAIVRYRGQLMALESKTSGEDITPGAAYWQRVAVMDPQVSMYLSAHPELVSCLYDVARKPELKPKVKESPDDYRQRCALDMQARPDWYFQRREVVRLDHETRAFQRDLWDYATMLSEAEKLGRFPRNPDHCRKYGRACEYLAVCMGEASIDDPVLFRTEDREKRNIHERTRQNPQRPAA